MNQTGFTHGHIISKQPPPASNSPITTRSNPPTPFTTTLNLFKQANSLVLSQKLYKVVISIDYTPHTTSLDFIKKSLEIVFEKIAREYDEFFSKCFGTEPQVYVTCLLWNLAYFYSNRPSSATNVAGSSFDESLGNLAPIPIPFTIIMHSKRLLKSNINEMARYLFAKINEAKSFIVDSCTSTGDFNVPRYI